MECQQLIDKITSKINSAYSKQLSYAGRLQIINNVDKKCRDYLWGSTEEARKVPLVSW
ncbi:hypothetical protein H5410_037309 [Solanum commersonii]|uniref:Uncharacterized protein n=1 Tax=Solanum commersonii TaxID=4109 RepID=A0A9J5Y7F3_SOLCO|nr:hypothetical protein H5410_037309 [Solanum commersonii]